MRLSLLLTDTDKSLSARLMSAMGREREAK